MKGGVKVKRILLIIVIVLATVGLLYGTYYLSLYIATIKGIENEIIQTPSTWLISGWDLRGDWCLFRGFIALYIVIGFFTWGYWDNKHYVEKEPLVEIKPPTEEELDIKYKNYYYSRFYWEDDKILKEAHRVGDRLIETCKANEVIHLNPFIFENIKKEFKKQEIKVFARVIDYISCMHYDLAIEPHTTLTRWY